MIFMVVFGFGPLNTAPVAMSSATKASAATPRGAGRAPDPRNPGCLVLDLAMPGLSGLELQTSLAAVGNEIPIIFLTGHGDIPTSVRAMKRGALDFLTKPVNDGDLLKAINTAIEKDRRARQVRAEREDIQARLDSLTPREREVLAHVVAGHLNKQTAAHLGTVEKTIKVHRARVMEKMRVESLAELVRLAQRVGLEMAE